MVGYYVCHINVKFKENLSKEMGDKAISSAIDWPFAQMDWKEGICCYGHHAQFI